jgi:hypothetical protein
MKNLKSGCYRFIVSFVVVFNFLNLNCFSQFYTAGVDPASVKWRQVKTRHFKLVYPTTFDKQAQYLANGLEYNYYHEGNSMDHPDFKIPVIIHNQTTIPSSVTPYAPRRMDYFTAPPQDLYPQDWVDQLIIHECRHAAQYSALNHGFTKALTYVLGQQGTFLTLGLFVPLWLIEGDATVAETALHNTGRGRTPSFEMHLRAQLVQDRLYSYEKATNGSYRNYVPGKYELGYQLVGLSRDIYGPNLWGNVLNDVGRHSYSPVPFSASIKKQTGYNKYILYDTLTHILQKKWLDYDRTVRENNYEILTKRNYNEFTSYNIPVILRDSLIVTVKSCLDNCPVVILIDRNKNEKKLFTASANFLSESLSTSDSILYWSEMTNDPRWSFRDYRVIKSYNYYTGKIQQLTNRSRYYAPSVSDNGKLIVTVEVTIDNKYFLVILDPKDGHIIKKISTPDNLLFVHPRWSADNKSIVSVVFGKQGNNLALINAETSRVETLLPYTSLEIKRPSFLNQFIIYQASYNGIDNIYSLDTVTHDIAKITTSRFGASDPIGTKDQSAIIYSNYTDNGFQLVKETIDKNNWIKVIVPAISAFPLAEKLTLQENFIFNSDSVPTVNYKTNKYIKALNLFNFHSWAPVGVDIQNITAAPGFTFLSQNLLSTNVTTLGYLYDRNQRTGKYFLSMTNESLYPAIDLSIDYGDRRDIKITSTSDTIPAKWKELNIYAGIRVPLKWTHNVWLRSFQPGIGVNYKNPNINRSEQFGPEHTQDVALNFSLEAENLMKASLRDIYPRWGQKLQVNFSNTPFTGVLNSFFAAQLTLNFPGIGRHHNLHLYNAYQTKTENLYSFANKIYFPRGTENIFSDKIFSFSALYSMPLFLPDCQLSHFLYIKRVKSALFYDFAKSYDKLSPRIYSSVGLDLTMDFVAFNFIAPFDAGLRSAFIPESGKMVFQVLFAIKLNSLY